MLIVHVHVHVKPESVDAFQARRRLENARNSVQEPGIARFDVIQQADDPARFVLVEVYRTAEATAAHKDTAHYQVWRDSVAGMMAEPRTSVKYSDVFPGRGGLVAMRFEFATATRIVFGPGTLREVAPAAREMGARALLVTGLLDRN